MGYINHDIEAQWAVWGVDHDMALFLLIRLMKMVIDTSLYVKLPPKSFELC